MSSFWHRILRRPNGRDDELDALKEELSQSQQRAKDAARRLARAAETVTRHKKENELAEMIQRFRASEGHD